MTVRTRFAPSPTGYLHIGGARTALYSYLFARKNKGIFILRIEDTDLERSTPESLQAILDGMKWLDLEHDEGPFYQTKRFDRYHAVIEQFLKEGKAYKCYCTKERLEALRNEQIANKQKPRYDGFCRDRKDQPNEPFVIRFRNPTEGQVVVNDLVHGKVVFENSELDDLIIARTDGSPTYNFTVVVDDSDMKITHVIRGDDHLNNTPRQMNMLQALGAVLPQYAHVPMILGDDGKRLSKRHGAVSVMQYHDEGYLPEALLNYLVRLGWSHGDQEIFSMDEMIQFFNTEHLNNSPAAFNPEKLLWLNQHYIKTLPVERIAKELKYYLQQINITFDDESFLQKVVLAQRERVKTLVEMAERSRYFFEDVQIQEKLADEIKPAFQQLAIEFSALNDWSAANIHQVIQRVAEAANLKMGKVAQPLRLVATGGTVSPSIDMTLELIGKERVLERINKALLSL